MRIHDYLQNLSKQIFDVGNILDLSECSPIIVFVSFLSQIRWAKVEEKKIIGCPEELLIA